MSNKVIRGRVLTFLDQPASLHDDACLTYLSDGAIAISDGLIAWVGPFNDLPAEHSQWHCDDHRPGLVMAGFIDAHTHFAQMGVIGSYGEQLLDWLETYTFNREAQFSDPQHARKIAAAFLDELVTHGVTTAAVFGTSHKGAIEALFSEADARGMRLIAGKCLMDRNAPEQICDTARSGYDDTKALIGAWHGKGRLSYAVTPRFAITSSPEQLELTGTLMREHPDCYLQTHLSENQAEIDYTAQLFPDAKDYLDVYDRFGLLGERALFGHCIHLTARERAVLAEARAVAVFCPTSNMFLGSGLFDYVGMKADKVRIALATDIGAGTSYSMLATASEAYKVCQLQHTSLNPLESFYLLTLGNARSLSLDDRIGQIAAGHEADLIVLDSQATPAMSTRMESAESLAEELFILQTLGDDRAVTATYIAGQRLK